MGDEAERFGFGHASGDGWHAATQACVAQLDPPPGANLGFVYVTDVLADRAGNAIAAFRERCAGGDTLVVAGGVAANVALRARLSEVAEAAGLRLVAPPPKLCTDNAAMIAWAGIERLRLGFSDGLDASPRARWPLDPDAPPATGAGIKA